MNRIKSGITKNKHVYELEICFPSEKLGGIEKEIWNEKKAISVNSVLLLRYKIETLKPCECMWTVRAR